MTYYSLTYFDLALASILLLVNGGLSIWFRLGIERSLAISAIRTFVQLSLVGLVLKFVFEQTSPLWTIGLMLIMGAAAGREVMARQSHALTGFWRYGLGTASLFFSGLLTTLFAVTVLIQPDPWYAPRYMLPILGMMFGNTLTGVALALDALTTAMERERPAIEARLAQGAERLEAVQGPLQQALRSGLMPMINAMAASGIVSLPGMMTGQILAGVDPQEAVKYQVLIMFLLSGAVGIAVLIAVFAALYRLTDERCRLRLERMEKRRAA